jgi:flagellar motor component MotA
LGGPPEEIGHKVAAALVGTFLGIVLCYGLVAPLAANMAKAVENGQCSARCSIKKIADHSPTGRGETYSASEEK